MTNIRSLGAIAALVVCVTDGSPAVADPPSSQPARDAPSIVLPETLVTAEPPRSIVVPSVEQAREQITRSTPGGVSVVDAEQTRAGRAQGVKDVLDFTPGVYVQPRNGAGSESRLSIRGSGLQRTFHLRGIYLLQDGVPITEADGSGDFETIEPLAIRYTEVFRGGNALRYGGTTLGGAINFASPTGYDAAPLTLRAEGGSFGYARGQIASGLVIDDLDYYVSATGLTLDGFREHSQVDAQRLFGNVGYRLSDAVETRLYFAAVNYDSEIPGALTKAQLEDDPEQAGAFQVFGDWRRDVDAQRLASKTTVRIDDDRRLDLTAFFVSKELDHPIFQYIADVSHDYGLGARYASDADLSGRRNRFVAGVGFDQLRQDHKQYLNVGGATKGAKTDEGERGAYNVVLYAEEQHYVLPRLAGVAGAQATYASRAYDDAFFANGDQSDRQDFAGFSPKVGAIYDMADDAQVFGNYSRSFEPPSFGELVNIGGSGLLGLDAQTADTIELGTRGRRGRVAWDVAVYRAWVRDELLGFNVSPGVSRTLNADDTVHQGIELGLDVELWRLDPAVDPPSGQTRTQRVLLRQVYNYNDFRFDDDPTFGDNRLPGIPVHFYRAELRYEHPGGFYAGPNVEWSPEHYPVDMANTLSADPYVLLGVRVGYRRDRGPSLFVEGRNLTDEKYAATTGVITDASAPGANLAQFNPGEGRSVYGGVEFSW